MKLNLESLGKSPVKAITSYICLAIGIQSYILLYEVPLLSIQKAWHLSHVLFIPLGLCVHDHTVQCESSMNRNASPRYRRVFLTVILAKAFKRRILLAKIAHVSIRTAQKLVSSDQVTLVLLEGNTNVCGVTFPGCPPE